jgi:hypothetical protein
MDDKIHFDSCQHDLGEERDRTRQSIDFSEVAQTLFTYYFSSPLDESLSHSLGKEGHQNNVEIIFSFCEKKQHLSLSITKWRAKKSVFLFQVNCNKWTESLLQTFFFLCLLLHYDLIIAMMGEEAEEEDESESEPEEMKLKREEISCIIFFSLCFFGIRSQA